MINIFEILIFLGFRFFQSNILERQLQIFCEFDAQKLKPCYGESSQKLSNKLYNTQVKIIDASNLRKKTKTNLFISPQE